jgi:hypothetical protein
MKIRRNLIEKQLPERENHLKKTQKTSLSIFFKCVQNAFKQQHSNYE